MVVEVADEHASRFKVRDQILDRLPTQRVVGQEHLVARTDAIVRSQWRDVGDAVAVEFDPFKLLQVGERCKVCDAIAADIQMHEVDGVLEASQIKNIVGGVGDVDDTQPRHV